MFFSSQKYYHQRQFRNIVLKKIIKNWHKHSEENADELTKISKNNIDSNFTSKMFDIVGKAT